MNMKRIMKLSVRALKKQYKLCPDVRFKDDDAKEVSLLDVANQLEAISGLMYPDAKEFAVKVMIPGKVFKITRIEKR